MKNISLIILGSGSRHFQNYERVKGILDNLLMKYFQKYNDKNNENILIIEGGAAGADSLFRQYAIKREIMHLTVPARWKSSVKNFEFNPKNFFESKDYNSLAGVERNSRMVNLLEDFPNSKKIFIAFPVYSNNIMSRGTNHCIQVVENYNKYHDNEIKIIIHKSDEKNYL